MKPITDTKTVEPTAPTKKSMLADAANMERKRDEKVEVALTDLQKKCEVLAQQYATANGVLEMLRLMKEIDAPTVDSIIQAKSLAQYANGQATLMAEKVAYYAVKNHCDGADLQDLVNYIDTQAYDTAYAYNEKANSFNSLALELIRLRIVQKVGPAATDILDFYNAATEDIKEVRKEAKELK